MKLLVHTAILMLCMSTTSSQAADTSAEIKSALDYYAEAWNEGDLELIRSYYHPDFVLVTPSGTRTLAERLGEIETVVKPGEDRGVLSHTEVTIREIEQKHAMAYGRFRLQFKDGTKLDGWFSTVYVKTPFGWKALLTHT
jgi:ketosteroid isomerase-like protein